MPDLDTVIRERRSVRGFLDKPVPREELVAALDVAQHAPSNCNVQPWRTFVASGPRRDKLRDVLCARMDEHDFGSPEDPIDSFPGEYRKLQVECAVEMYGHMGIERKDMQGRLRALKRNYELFDAPHVAVICMEKHFGIGVALDVGMYVQSLMLALWARGIGSCPQAALRHYPKEIRDVLGIREDLRIMCGLSFGYEDEAVPVNRTRQGRNPVDTNVTFLDD